MSLTLSTRSIDLDLEILTRRSLSTQGPALSTAARRHWQLLFSDLETQLGQVTHTVPTLSHEMVRLECWAIGQIRDTESPLPQTSEKKLGENHKEQYLKCLARLIKKKKNIKSSGAKARRKETGLGKQGCTLTACQVVGGKREVLVSSAR